jgi:predicted secreted hydrolase
MLELDLAAAPRLRDQELDLAFRYWEGAVAVEGSRAGEPVTGRGYVELTGYADRPMP